MAKKNFDNLVNNMLGVDQRSASTTPLLSASSIDNESQITESVAPSPKRASSSEISESFCGRASSLKLSKLRSVSEWENIPIKDIYNAAFDLFINAYEAKHGQIKVKTKQTKGDINKLL